jgi:Siphovirus Gp157
MPLPKHLFSNLAVARPACVTPIRAEVKAERDREAVLRTKIDRVHRLLSALEARAAACDLAIKQAQARKKAACARAERIEDRVLLLMQDAGLKEVAGRHVTLMSREAGVPKLIVDNEALIPSEYMRQPKPPKPAPDALAIKAALDSDPDLMIPGVHLAQTVSLIRK